MQAANKLKWKSVNLIQSRTGVSSFEHLLGHERLRVVVWLVALATLVGNLTVLGGRCCIGDDNKVLSLFIRNLAGEKTKQKQKQTCAFVNAVRMSSYETASDHTSQGISYGYDVSRLMQFILYVDYTWDTSLLGLPGKVKRLGWQVNISGDIKKKKKWSRKKNIFSRKM